MPNLVLLLLMYTWEWNVRSCCILLLNNTEMKIEQFKDNVDMTILSKVPATDPETSLKKSETLMLKKTKKVKSKFTLFDKDEIQNVTAVGALLRSVLVIFIPIISVSIDWYLNMKSMYFIAPLIVYFAVTAMTRSCPIKGFFVKNKVKVK